MITLPYPNTDPLLNHPSLPDHLPLSPLLLLPLRNPNPHPISRLLANPTPIIADPVPRTAADPVPRTAAGPVPCTAADPVLLLTAGAAQDTAQDTAQLQMISKLFNCLLCKSSLQHSTPTRMLKFPLRTG